MKNQTKKQVSKGARKFLETSAQLVVGVVGSVILLGLASVGASNYLKNMSPDQRTIVSVLAVALLAWCVVTSVKKILK